MFYDLRNTFADGLPVVTGGTVSTGSGSNFGTVGNFVLGGSAGVMDLSTLLTNMTPAPNTSPQYPYGGGLNGVLGTQLRNLAGGQPFYLVLRLRNTANPASNNVVLGATATLNFQLWTADSTDLVTTNASQIAASPTFGNQTLNAGTVLLFVALPVAALHRYLGVRVFVGTAAPTGAGTVVIDAFLTLDPTNYLASAQPSVT